MNDQRYRRVEKERYTNIRHNETRPDDTLGLYYPDVDHFRASPTANNRRYVALVQVISAVGEYHCLQSMAPSTDTQLLNTTDNLLHLCQPVLSPRYILKRWCRHYRVRGSLPTSLFIWYLYPPFGCCRGDVGLFTIREKSYPISNECSITDNLAYVSLAFLTFKILTGAFWIKETWGHYWSWAPRRLEKPSPSLPIWSISTTNKRTHTGCEAHYGFWLQSLHCFKSVGRISTICHLHKIPIFIRITCNDKRKKK